LPKSIHILAKPFADCGPAVASLWRGKLRIADCLTAVANFDHFQETGKHGRAGQFLPMRLIKSNFINLI
jgi:hypothetical protein